MWCKDPFLTLLKQFGYNVVRLPRTNIAPLHVLSRSGSNLDMLGDLSSILVGGTVPPITRDTQAATISGSNAKTGSMDAGVATGLLGGVIAAMGGSKVGIDGAYSKAKSITFEFLDVKQDAINITDLDKYLSAARPDPDSRSMATLLKSSGVYVLTATIKSKKLSVRAEDASGQSLKVDLSGVQQLVGGNVGVKQDDKGASSLVYEGPEPLVFGFQAVQILFDKTGQFQGFKRIDADAVAMRDIDSPSGDFVLLDTANSPFVRIGQGTSTPANVGRRALLIGVNDYPLLEARHQLKGCVNDAKVMAATLRDRFAFPESDIEVLLNEKATRDNILSAMDRLVDRTEPQDVVVIQYSGHGSQVEDREGDEPTGKDQTIVPCDSGRKDPNPNRDITDDEIFERLRKLAAKTDRITLLFDCCHSGTITRDDDFGEGARSLEEETRSVDVLPVASLSRETIDAMTKSGPSGFLPIDGSYVLIAGCRDEEKSFEHKIRTSTGEMRHGALTYFLTKELAKAPAGATYRDVFERAAQKVTGTFFNQHPQMEGASDRELFGVSSRKAARSVLVERTTTDGVKLSAGSAQGLTEGSKWAIYPQGHKEEDGDTGRLGVVTVTEVGALSSDAHIDEVIAPDSIATGTRAIELEHNLGPMSLSVEVEDLSGVHGAGAALQSQIGLSSLLKKADAGTATARVYGLPKGDPASRAGKAPQLGTLAEPTWAAIGRDGFLMFPTAPIEAEDSLERVLTNLEKIARYRNVLSLENHDPSDALAGKVRLVLLRRLANGSWIEAVPGDDGRVVIREGEKVGIRIINDHDSDVFVSVLDFGLTGRIKQLYPARGAKPAHKPGTFDPGLIIGLSFPPDFDRNRNEGEEAFKLIATTEPSDFTLLEQDATRDVKELEASKSLSPLEMLLASAGGGTRDGDVVMASGTGWTASLCRFTLVRKPASP